MDLPSGHTNDYLIPVSDQFSISADCSWTKITPGSRIKAACGKSGIKLIQFLGDKGSEFRCEPFVEDEPNLVLATAPDPIRSVCGISLGGSLPSLVGGPAFDGFSSSRSASLRLVLIRVPKRV